MNKFINNLLSIIDLWNQDYYLKWYNASNVGKIKIINTTVSN